MRFPISGRVHINIGRTLLAIAIISIAWTLACEPVMAEERLTFAQSGNWSSDFYVGNDTDSAITFETAPCQIAPCLTRVTIAPSNAARVSAPSGFGTLSAPAGKAYSLLRFNDSRTSQSYAVPTVGALTTDPKTYGPISTSGRVTTVNVFPESPTAVDVVIHLGGGAADYYSFEARPPVTQHVVETKVDAAMVSLSLRRCQVAPCLQPSALYGFIAVSDPEGGNAAVIPFR